MNSEFSGNIVDSTGAPLVAWGETVFLKRLFEELEAQLGDDFSRFTFVVHRRVFGEIAGSKINLDPGGPNRVLIVISDECEAFPCQEFQSYRVVFRAYGSPLGGDSRIHAFPVGYLNAAGLVEPVEFDQRQVTVFFSGYLNRNRLDVYKQFRPVWWLPKRNLSQNRYIREIARRAAERFTKERSFPDAIPGGHVAFTDWFGRGLAPEEYAQTLANSRIAICPPGFESHETIRHWEAMRLGCVVISAPLPPNRFYSNSPIIQLSDWSDLKPTVNRLLNNPSELRARHLATVDWWKKACSEKAVADYMARIIVMPDS
ncbi:hypothetical protein [Luteolibacter soli]|uniref:Exostosin GT47 domain-containing protein n=1 Tax=Luteolibacter soli TaxID=3135280 RepID=A0ABU9ASW7_9BACT